MILCAYEINQSVQEKEGSWNLGLWVKFFINYQAFFTVQLIRYFYRMLCVIDHNIDKVARAIRVCERDLFVCLRGTRPPVLYFFGEPSLAGRELPVTYRELSIPPFSFLGGIFFFSTLFLFLLFFFSFLSSV